MYRKPQLQKLTSLNAVNRFYWLICHFHLKFRVDKNTFRKLQSKGKKYKTSCMVDAAVCEKKKSEMWDLRRGRIATARLWRGESITDLFLFLFFQFEWKVFGVFCLRVFCPLPHFKGDFRRLSVPVLISLKSRTKFTNFTNKFRQYFSKCLNFVRESIEVWTRYEKSKKLFMFLTLNN